MEICHISSESDPKIDVEQKTPIKQLSYVGTIFLMITFGSSFGYTVLGRISLLIGRVQDLYIFGERRYGYASIFCAIVVILYLIAWELNNRKKAKINDEY